MKIGNISIKNNVFLAPMAGVTDIPFRVLCKEQGAGLLGMEMISAKAIWHNSKKTYELMEVLECEHPVSLQLFGNDADIISEMAKRIEHIPFDILDINMGCPVAKVVNNGEGSALMKSPLLVGDIISKTARAISKPVTVKIRKGYDNNSINAVEIAHIAQESGAAAVAVHGRTREEFYHGKADWRIISQVKERLSIPVIGNGDIHNGRDARRMLDETRCDAIMIARGARGNPWIFREIEQYLAIGRDMPRPSMQEVGTTILRHGRMQIEHKGEYLGIRQMRKHLSWYTVGYPGAIALRRDVNSIMDYADLERIVSSFFGI